MVLVDHLSFTVSEDGLVKVLKQTTDCLSIFHAEELMMAYDDNQDNIDIEALRRKLLDEVYAMTFSGMSAAFLDEDKIKHANTDELIEIARRYGF